MSFKTREEAGVKIFYLEGEIMPVEVMELQERIEELAGSAEGKG